jgi:hypothetical protein
VKRVITAAVLAQIPEHQSIDLDISLDQVITKWWMTNRQAGLRLTELGDMAFKLASIEYFTCPLGKTTPGGYYSFLIEVNKKIKCPYFLGVNKSAGEKNEPFIRLYDSKIAVLMSLYGDLHSYLESIPNSNIREKK